MSNFVKPGLGSVGQYQMSGKPQVKTVAVGNDTGSGYGQMVEFSTVTNRITIKSKASTGNVIVHFKASASAARAAGEYYLLEGGDSLTLEARASKIYISKETTGAGSDGSVSLCAELTNIDQVISYES
tara:strand:+ start:1568 stop:1951 length:384 start_codon:yes stop_codon:yes gene_type:complete